jgi:hypothetical protein
LRSSSFTKFLVLTSDIQDANHYQFPNGTHEPGSIFSFSSFDGAVILETKFLNAYGRALEEKIPRAPRPVGEQLLQMTTQALAIWNEQAKKKFNDNLEKIKLPGGDGKLSIEMTR